MTLVDIAELQRLLAPRLSPDGSTLAYMLTKADWKAGRAIAHLWRQDVSGTPVQLTFSEAGDIPAPRSVRWAPDGKRFASVGQDNKVFLFDLATGKKLATSDLANAPTAAEFSADGKMLTVKQGTASESFDPITLKKLP